MKIYLHDDFIEEDYENGKQVSVYGMANLQHDDINQPFDIWIDEFGKNRNTTHYLARFKPRRSGQSLEIVVKKDWTVDFGAACTESQKRKFGKSESKKAIQFIDTYKKVLVMHYNGELTTVQLSAILLLAIKGKVDLDEAISTVLDKYKPES